MEAIVALQAKHRRLRRSQHAYVWRSLRRHRLQRVLKSVGELVGECGRRLLIAAADDDARQTLIGWIIVLSAMGHLRGHEAGVIMRRSQGDAGMLRRERLHENTAALWTASGPPRHLR